MSTTKEIMLDDVPPGQVFRHEESLCVRLSWEAVMAMFCCDRDSCQLSHHDVPVMEISDGSFDGHFFSLNRGDYVEVVEVAEVQGG